MILIIKKCLIHFFENDLSEVEEYKITNWLSVPNVCENVMVNYVEIVFQYVTIVHIMAIIVNYYVKIVTICK